MFLSDYKWKAFLAVALSLFTMVMSMNITILALPVIARDFAVTLREVSWIVIAFSLTVTALLLPMGRLSDLIGRKKTLVSGIGLFIVGSLVCYLAESLFMLILGRVVMGIGASMGQGVGTAIVVSVFPQHERGKAIGSHTTVVAIGSAGGPVMAGVLLQFFPWQVIFLAVAVPAVLAFFLGLLILDDARIGSFQAEDTVFDWTGACLSALLMLFFVLTLNSPFPSENDFWILLIGIPGTLILLRTFIFWELKTGSPLLDLKLFSSAAFSYASLTRFLGFMSRSGGMLLLPVFLLNIRGMNEMTIGLLMFSGALGMGIGAQSGGRLSDIFGPRRFVIFGFFLAALNGMLMAWYHQQTPLLLIVVTLFVNGISMGLWATPNQVITLNATPKSKYGPVGALINLTRNTGNVTGQAIATAVISAVLTFQGFDIELSQVGKMEGSLEAFTLGWRVAYFVIILLLCLSMFTASRTRPKPNETIG
ncbi:MAG: hypothetical protein CL925_10810 [Deltaproteobacteria bacterium]|nr:hypothetical protein [Deltaproteobacteria bacterium]